jgi:hypothetical protein
VSVYKQGDRVRLVHGYGREATVSSATDTDVMLCMFIAGRYQLRGPFRLDEVERAEGESA